MRSYLWLKQWGILPRAGGLDDQDPAWLDDIETALRQEQYQAQPWPDKLKTAFNRLTGRTDNA